MQRFAELMLSVAMICTWSWTRFRNR